MKKWQTSWFLENKIQRLTVAEIIKKMDIF